MLEILLKHLPQIAHPTENREVISPDGRLGHLSLITTRSGDEGSINCFAFKTEAGAEIFLQVFTRRGKAIIPITLPSNFNGDAIATALANSDILQKVINYFPLAEMETLGATKKPESHRPLL